VEILFVQFFSPVSVHWTSKYRSKIIRSEYFLEFAFPAKAVHGKLCKIFILGDNF